MSDPTKKVSSIFSTLVLYVLASPIFALKAIGSFVRSYRTATLVRAGFLRCSACGRGNRLDVLVTCPRCSFAEFRSLALPCSECGYVPGFLSCTGCGASVRLP
ncbi:MAG TPA: hypothetical protein P5164_06560 [Thermoanaerobaculia bacterium]|nr:hypothetical protein [Thermoanaerobaculia bacterium]